MTDSLTAAGEQPVRTQRGLVLRIVVALPFFLLGGVWCLLWVRAPARLAEAWSRSAAAGWQAVVGDAAFAESLWRCTVLPATGLGRLCVGWGILRHNTLVGISGCGWAIVVFSVGSLILR